MVLTVSSPPEEPDKLAFYFIGKEILRIERSPRSLTVQVFGTGVQLGGRVLDIVRSLTSPVNEDIKKLLGEQSAKITIKSYSLEEAISKTEKLGYDSKRLWTASAQCAAKMERDLWKFKQCYQKGSSSGLAGQQISVHAMSTQLCNHLNSDLLDISENVKKLLAGEECEGDLGGEQFDIDTTAHNPGPEYYSKGPEAILFSTSFLEHSSKISATGSFNPSGNGRKMSLPMPSRDSSNLQAIICSNEDSSKTDIESEGGERRKHIISRYVKIHCQAPQCFPCFKHRLQPNESPTSDSYSRAEEGACSTVLGVNPLNIDNTSMRNPLLNESAGELIATIGPKEDQAFVLGKAVQNDISALPIHALFTAYGCLASHLDLIEEMHSKSSSTWSILEDIYSTTTVETDHPKVVQNNLSTLRISLGRQKCSLVIEILVPKQIPRKVKEVIVFSVICRHPNLRKLNSLSKWFNATSTMANGKLREVEILFLARNGGLVNNDEYNTMVSSDFLISKEGIQYYKNSQRRKDKIEENEELANAVCWAHHFTNHKFLSKESVTRVIVSKGMVAIYDAKERELGLVNANELIDVGREVKIIQRFQSEQVTLRDVLRLRMLISAMYNGNPNPKSADLLMIMEPATSGLAEVKYSDGLNYCKETLQLNERESSALLLASFHAADRKGWRAMSGKFNGVLVKLLMMQVDDEAERRIQMDHNFAYFGTVGIFTSWVFVKDVEGMYNAVYDAERPLLVHKRRDGYVYRVDRNISVEKVDCEEEIELNLG